MANDGVNEPVNTGRRRFLTATTAVVGAVGAGFVAVPFIKSWNPSAQAKLAGAPVTADLTGLQEGQRLVLEWRGQPIWIVKRTKAVLDALPSLDSRLRDPESTNKDQQPEYVLKDNPEYRSVKPDISVLVGLCTHLGCSPEMVAEIKAAARDYGVDEAIVRAIIHAESSFNPMALSHAGAQGLMQLMPATARRFGVTNSYDAGQNIRGGVQYLAWLLKRFNGNLTLAAAGYNAGEGAVDRHGGVPPYQETQRYVARVGQLADRYRGVVSAR